MSTCQISHESRAVLFFLIFVHVDFHRLLLRVFTFWLMSYMSFRISLCHSHRHLEKGFLIVCSFIRKPSYHSRYHAVS